MVRFTLRIPNELHGEMVSLAKGKERSLNSQIVYILKTWIDYQGVNDAGLPAELELLGSTVKQEVGSS